MRGYETIEDAVDAWNARAPSPAVEAVVEAAKVWRKHHVCCPNDCQDMIAAEKALGDSLDALAALKSEGE